MTKAVIYARYSSVAQQDQSIDGQLRDCRAFAEKNDYFVVNTYIDRALSGRSDERPRFQDMIKDAEKHGFSYIIVWKLDRFSRNRYDSAFYKSRLKKHGVRVISATEPISDEPEGIILEGMLESIAEYYSANLAKHVKRGQRENVLEGRYFGGTPPIGYKAEDRRLVVDERSADTVRRIFRQYADGMPKQQILNDLSARGFRHPHTGKPITMNTLTTLLRQKRYIGVYEFEGKTIEDWCPAIVDRSTFERVQQLLDQRKRAPAAGKAKERYLLQGKIFCGYCRSPMVGESGRGRHGDVYHYYACAQKKKHHTCRKKNERKDYIEWYIVEQATEYVLRPDIRKRICSKVAEISKKDKTADDIAALRRRAAQCETELEKLVDAIIALPKSAQPRIAARMDDLEKEKASIEVEISEMENAAPHVFTEKEVDAWLSRFCNGDLFDPAFRDRIISVFINSVYLYDDKVLIFYNLRDGKQVCVIEELDEIESEFDLSDGGEVRISDASGHQQRTHFCLPKVCSLFIQAAGLVYHPPSGGISSKAARRLCISSRHRRV